MRGFVSYLVLQECCGKVSIKLGKYVLTDLYSAADSGISRCRWRFRAPKANAKAEGNLGMLIDEAPLPDRYRHGAEDQQIADRSAAREIPVGKRRPRLDRSV